MGCGLSCARPATDNHNHKHGRGATVARASERDPLVNQLDNARVARDANIESDSNASSTRSECEINHKSFAQQRLGQGTLGAAQMAAAIAHNWTDETPLFFRTRVASLEERECDGGSRERPPASQNNLRKSNSDKTPVDRRAKRPTNQRVLSKQVGALLSLLFQGRRHSGARIDASREPPEARARDLDSPKSYLAPQPRTAQVASGEPKGASKIEQQTEGASPHANQSLICECSPAPGMSLVPQPVGRARSPSAHVGAQSAPAIKLESAPEVSGAEMKAPDSEVVLVTSLDQLCHEIIQQKLLARGVDAQIQNQVQMAAAAAAYSDTCTRMCLFIFGGPGSSKGELAFELVEHSALVQFIARAKRGGPPSAATNDENAHPGNDCPLYHYLDVSALIVANIDNRIREYNRLVARALRSRRNQSGGERGVRPGSSVDSDEVKNLRSTRRVLRARSQEEDDGMDLSESSQFDVTPSQGSKDDDADDNLSGDRLRRESSIASDESTASGLSCLSRSKSPTRANDDEDDNSESHKAGGAPNTSNSHPSDQFGLVTLSTKQRSIMQLKMVRYACCVSAKWVMSLIEREICALEERLREATRRGSEHLSGERDGSLPARVYLVNLVPDQLSLFRTCLYLQQDLPLGKLKMPHWAVKFERRTNIKLMSKERAASPTSQSNCHVASPDKTISPNPGSGKRVLIQFKKLSQIKLPTLLAHTATTTSPGVPSTLSCRPGPGVAPSSEHDVQRGDGQQTVGAIATSLLASGPSNEKLGPKYNDLFAEQFEKLARLTRLRYNPMRNYNYSDQVGDQNHGDRLWPKGGEAAGERPRNSCYLSSIGRQHSQSTSDDSLEAAGDSDDRPATGASQTSPPRDDHLDRDPTANISRFQYLECPSPCPSTSLVSSDESLAGGSTLSHDAESPQPLEQQQQQHRRHWRPSAQPSSTAHPKWAIELELVDGEQSTKRWPHAKVTDSPAPGGQETAALVSDGCLRIYRNDKAARPIRSRSHSSLLFASTASNAAARADQRANSTTPGATASNHREDPHAENHYYLVATRVAYAKGKSQCVLEVKRLHKRVIRCTSSSRSDLAKLRKIIDKARANLAHDLSSWLGAAIASEQPSRCEQREESATPLRNCGLPKSIALVTYTIRVDVGKFQLSAAPDATTHEVSPGSTRLSACGDESSPKPTAHKLAGDDRVWQLLQMQPKRSSLAKQRPTSAIPLDSRVNNNSGTSLHAQSVHGSRASLQVISSSHENGEAGRAASNRQRSSTTSSGKQRHVQFKLTQAPSCQGCSRASQAGCLAQRRVWLRDSLFASSSESRLFQVMDSLVEALKSQRAGVQC